MPWDEDVAPGVTNRTPDAGRWNGRCV